MNSRRTRRDVLSATAGLSLALAAGCLDDGEANGASNGDGDGDEADGRSTYREWVLGASASSTVDPSELTVGQFDLAAIDAVSELLSDEIERELIDAAYANVFGIDETLGRENVDATFSFDTRGGPGQFESVSCQGFEGTFDIDSLREEIEAEGDVDHRTVGGFDVYTEPGLSAVLSSELVVDLSGSIDAVSLLERIQSGEFERDGGGDDGDTDDFETLASHLDDGALVVGDLRSSTNVSGESGWGGSVAFDGPETTVRLVWLYDEAPDDETIADVENSVEEGYGLGAYGDASVDVDGRAIVTTARVDTEEYRGVPW